MHFGRPISDLFPITNAFSQKQKEAKRENYQNARVKDENKKTANSSPKNNGNDMTPMSKGKKKMKEEGEKDVQDKRVKRWEG